jgi:hypothetical protein
MQVKLRAMAFDECREGTLVTGQSGGQVMAIH